MENGYTKGVMPETSLAVQWWDWASTAGSTGLILVRQLGSVHVCAGWPKKSATMRSVPVPVCSWSTLWAGEEQDSPLKNTEWAQENFPHIEDWKSSKNSEFAVYSPYIAGHQAKPPLTRPRTSEPPCLTLTAHILAVSTLLKKIQRKDCVYAKE